MRSLGALALAALLTVAVAAPASARTTGPTIVDVAVSVNASNGEFDHLIAAVDRSDLLSALDGKRQFTVFAPTDAAFESLFDVLGVSSVDEIDLATLRAVLLYHVAPGERFASSVLDSTRIRTLSGGFLRPSLQGAVPYVNDAQILIPDVDASNGVIHVIDQVLLPA
jgi:transforming growth factor-beta-induced protein